MRLCSAKRLRWYFTILGITLVANLSLHAQTSCSDYGQAIYCSNGLSAIRSGSTLYFSDGTIVQSSGDTLFISGRSTTLDRTSIADSAAAANYQAGQTMGALVGGVISNVKQRRRFDRICDVDPYARGLLNGMLAFCSKAAILDACSNVPQFDFSGFKYSGDTPHHLSWDAAGKIRYLPNWPRFDGEIECVLDVAAHFTHEAQLWLTHKKDVEAALVSLHPHLSQDDSARIVNYIFTHPEAYDAGKVYKGEATQMFQKIYIAVKASS